MQIVQPRIGIVVIATVTERIVCPDNVSFRHGNAGFRGDSEISPCIVGVGTDLVAVLVVDGYDITEQILLEVEGMKIVGGVVVLTVLQTNRCSALVVEIHEHSRAPCLADNPAAFQRVIVPRAVGIFGGADAVGGVGVGLSFLDSPPLKRRGNESDE